ncbi:homocysteine S-methyltransferase family protein [Solirubrobacter soli]|uniref:homocysteine S-methyltransferase family protein n=1 Tax=Solirubrobacter soli TaxID=363832 RepID=UPI0004045F36|nr:homocysteine S-methyltransferase family protein [Solirubrobacter soli]
MDRPLMIDSGHRHRREVERRHGLRQLVSNPGDVLERHRRDVRAGADVVTTATWGIAAATVVSPEPDRWMTIARRGVRLARLAIAAQKRVGKVAVGFSIDSTMDLDDGGTISRLVDLFHAEHPDFLILDARSPRQPMLEQTVRALESARLPLWLSMPRAPRSIDWLEQRGKRTRLVDQGLLEITRW